MCRLLSPHGAEGRLGRVLAHFFRSNRKKYAVEMKQAKNYHFDAVGSQQVLKAFDRKEAVKRVKRNLVPCVHTFGLH